MLNNIDKFIAHLNESPESADGFSAKEFYSTGQQFGLTCREIQVNFLGKDRAISRGKYPASVSDEVLEAAKNAPAPTAKKAAKKAARNKSTKVITKDKVKDDEAKAARLSLIATIAKRHADEDQIIADSQSDSESTATEAHDDGTQEEFEKLQAASTSNPSVA